jgi:hypothetical protein
MIVTKVGVAFRKRFGCVVMGAIKSDDRLGMSPELTLSNAPLVYSSC